MMITKLDASPIRDSAARVRKLIYTDPNVTAEDVENEIRAKSSGCSEFQYYGPERGMDPEAPNVACAIVWTKEIRAA